MKSFIVRIFESNSGVSSKRIFGALGWLICLGLAIFCCANGIEAPAIVEIITYCSTGLLGLDTLNGTIGSLFHKNGKIKAGNYISPSPTTEK